MSSDAIHYRKRRHWLFRLDEQASFETGIEPPEPVDEALFSLSMSGLLTIEKGYSWDGPSGRLTLKTTSFMIGSLVHDCLYQMMREGKLPRENRKAADVLMKKINRASGMVFPRVYWTYWAVRVFGAPFVWNDIKVARLKRTPDVVGKALNEF